MYAQRGWEVDLVVLVGTDGVPGWREIAEVDALGRRDEILPRNGGRAGYDRRGA